MTPGCPPGVAGTVATVWIVVLAPVGSIPSAVGMPPKPINLAATEPPRGKVAVAPIGLLCKPIGMTSNAGCPRVARARVVEGRPMPVIGGFAPAQSVRTR